MTAGQEGTSETLTVALSLLLPPLLFACILLSFLSIIVDTSSPVNPQPIVSRNFPPFPFTPPCTSTRRHEIVCRETGPRDRREEREREYKAKTMTLGKRERWTADGKLEERAKVMNEKKKGPAMRRDAK